MPWASLGADDLLPEDLLAGMLPRSSESPVEYLGSAAVSDGRVSGVLTARETQAVFAGPPRRRGCGWPLTASRCSCKILLDEKQRALRAASGIDGRRGEASAPGLRHPGLYGNRGDAFWHRRAVLRRFAFRRRYSQAPVVIAPR